MSKKIPDSVSVRSLAAEVYKVIIGHSVLLAKGVPHQMHFKSFAESAWQAAQAFFDADMLEEDGELAGDGGGYHEVK